MPKKPITKPAKLFGNPQVPPKPITKPASPAPTPKPAPTSASGPAKSLTPSTASEQPSVVPQGVKALTSATQKSLATAGVPKAASAEAAATRALPPQPLPKQTTQSAAATAPAPAPTAPEAIHVTFGLNAPQAQRVALCGDFNQWSPDATPMTRKESGRWEATLAVQRGRYQYKFLADGEWIHDPRAQENVPNLYGSLNSVIEI